MHRLTALLTARTQSASVLVSELGFVRASVLSTRRDRGYSRLQCGRVHVFNRSLCESASRPRDVSSAPRLSHTPSCFTHGDVSLLSLSTTSSVDTEFQREGILDFEQKHLGLHKGKYFEIMV